MKWKLLILILTFFSLSSTAQIAWWYVVNEDEEISGDIYVSNDGNDSWDGSAPSYVSGTTGPIATIAELQTRSLSGGDTVLFERGDIWNEDYTIQNSGSSGSPIVFGAYGSGSKPIIYGSDIISGTWTVHSGNIYKISYSSNLIERLFLDGNSQTLAREPDVGYHYVDVVNSSTSFTSSDLNSGINYSGATWHGRTITWDIRTVSVSSSSGTTVTLSSAPANNLGVDEGFIMVNKLDFLDQAGEWYHDGSTLYVWTPDGTSPSNYVVRGAVRDYGFDSNYDNYHIVENISFQQQIIAGYYAYGSDYNIVTNCDFIDQDGYGIFTENATDYYSFDNNSISGQNGIAMYLSTRNSDIDNNYIRDIGEFDQMTVNGYWARYAPRGIEANGYSNTIAYNTIKNIGYNGIQWRDQNVTIEYNYIDSTCTVIDDGGAIYSSGGISNAGSVVRYNIITNVLGNDEGYTYTNRPFGEGIYLDEQTRGVSVYGNTVFNVSSGGIYLHINSTSANTVRDNTIMDFRYGIYAVGNTVANTMNSNIIYARDYDIFETQQILAYLASTDPTSLDSNKYYNHYNTTNIFQFGTTEYNTLSAWQSASGEDAAATIDNTQFTTETDTIFINPTQSAVNVDLGIYSWEDVDGNSVTSLTLQPYQSKILINTGAAEPDAPDATAATNVYSIQFDANWNVSTGATGYYLDVSENTNFSTYVSGFQNLDVGNVLTKTVTGLSEFTDYYYRVRAYNGAGTSGNSDTISTTTDDGIPPPIALEATSVGETSFIANWIDSSYYGSYRIYISEDSDFSTHVTGWNGTYVGTGSSYLINTGLTAGTTYYYRLDAYYTDYGLYSGYSNTITVATTSNTPSYDSSGTLATSNTTTLNVPYPSTESGQEMILVLANDAPSVMGTPTGWTSINNASSSGAVYGRVFSKTATGSESGSLACTMPSGNNAGQIFVFDNVTTVTAGSGWGLGSTTSTSLTSDAGVDTLSMTIIVLPNNYTVSVNTEFTERSSSTTSNNGGWSIFLADYLGDGSTSNSATFSWNPTSPLLRFFDIEME